MKKKKISFKKVLAYILILAGIGVMTFPFLIRSANFYSKKAAYRNFLKNSDIKEEESLQRKAKAYNKKIKTTDQALVDPFDGKSFQSDTILKNKDQVFAYIRIPKIDKYLPIYLDASLDHIAKGVAQIAGTDIPVGGKGTRSVIAGHRDRRGDTMFLFLDDLEEGDSIYIERKSKKLQYKVFSKEVIGPYDRDKLKPVPGEDILTLLTCDPFYPPRPNRLIVNARRVDKEDKKPVEEEKEEKAEKSGEKGEESVEKTDPKSKRSGLLNFVFAILGLYFFIRTLRKFLREMGFFKEKSA